MAINYSLGIRTVYQKNEKVKRVYASAQSQSVMSLKEFSDHISCHNSVFDRSVVEGVLIKMVSCLREQLLLGRIVNLGDLGSFRASLSSKPTMLASEFTSENIKRVRTVWRPTPAFSDMMEDATFQYVTSRAAQAQSKKTVKEDIDSEMKGSNPGGEEEGPSGE
ncbi:MAG: DNA-binding protein [Bacteroidaceae bacterium]|nr:DNA-binding protein [Bacteroidaceae bacterium]